MFKKLSGLAALCLIVLVSGCTLTLAPAPETKVQVENSLTNLSVDVGGTTTAVDAIDLEGVTVGGDAYFSYIAGGNTSSAKVTTSSGNNVTIAFDSAYVWTKVLGVSIKVGFKITTTMTTSITKEVTNTVLMDQSTASALIGSLAKKLAK